MDRGKVIKKQSRAIKQCHQRSVVIDGKRIITSLDIGEIPLQKDRHIRVEPSAVWHGQIGTGGRPRFLAVSSLG